MIIDCVAWRRQVRTIVPRSWVGDAGAQDGSGSTTVMVPVSGLMEGGGVVAASLTPFVALSSCSNLCSSARLRQMDCSTSSAEPSAEAPHGLRAAAG